MTALRLLNTRSLRSDRERLTETCVMCAQTQMQPLQTRVRPSAQRNSRSSGCLRHRPAGATEPRGPHSTTYPMNTHNTHRHRHTHTHTHTHNRHTHTHTHTHVCFCEKWGLSIGVMVFILYKLYVLLPYTNATPKLSPKKLTLYDL